MWSAMTWRRGMKNMTVGLGAVGRSRLPSWGPGDAECAWLETLKDMARNRSQWRSYCLSPVSLQFQLTKLKKERNKTNKRQKTLCLYRYISFSDSSCFYHVFSLFEHIFWFTKSVTYIYIYFIR